MLMGNSDRVERGKRDQPATSPQSKLLAVGDFDAIDELDSALAKSYEALLKCIQTSVGGSMTDSNAHRVLQEKVSEGSAAHSHVANGLLYGILINSQAALKYFSLLTSVTRDNYATLLTTARRLVLEKWTKLLDGCRAQILWLFRILLPLNVPDIDGLFYCLLRQVAAGNLSLQNTWLAAALLDAVQAHHEWLLGNPNAMASALYTYLRLLPDHSTTAARAVPGLQELQKKEVALCVRLLTERPDDCAAIGRDLVRALLDVSSLPEFHPIWRTFLAGSTASSSSATPTASQPSRLVQQYATRTPVRFLALRLTPDMETQLRFILSHVRMGQQRRYQAWFSHKFLSSPEATENGTTLIPDIIRFIVCAVHPSNQVLQSDVIPRWALIGWLLKSCRSCHVESSAKLALLFDWLFFQPTLPPPSAGSLQHQQRPDSIMNIEPGILCIVHSLHRYPELSNSLLEFVFLLLDNFDPPNAEVLKAGLAASVGTLVSKGVITSLDAVVGSNAVAPSLRDRLRRDFPGYCSSTKVSAPLRQGSAATLPSEVQPVLAEVGGRTSSGVQPAAAEGKLREEERGGAATGAEEETVGRRGTEESATSTEGGGGNGDGGESATHIVAGVEAGTAQEMRGKEEEEEEDSAVVHGAGVKREKRGLEEEASEEEGEHVERADEPVESRPLKKRRRASSSEGAGEEEEEQQQLEEQVAGVLPSDDLASSDNHGVSLEGPMHIPGESKRHRTAGTREPKRRTILEVFDDDDASSAHQRRGRRDPNDGAEVHTGRKGHRGEAVLPRKPERGAPDALQGHLEVLSQRLETELNRLSRTVRSMRVAWQGRTGGADSGENGPVQSQQVTEGGGEAEARSATMADDGTKRRVDEAASALACSLDAFFAVQEESSSLGRARNSRVQAKPTTRAAAGPEGNSAEPGDVGGGKGRHRRRFRRVVDEDEEEEEDSMGGTGSEVAKSEEEKDSEIGDTREVGEEGEKVRKGGQVMGVGKFVRRLLQGIEGSLEELEEEPEEEEDEEEQGIYMRFLFIPMTASCLGLSAHDSAIPNGASEGDRAVGRRQREEAGKELAAVLLKPFVRPEGGQIDEEENGGTNGRKMTSKEEVAKRRCQILMEVLLELEGRGREVTAWLLSWLCEGAEAGREDRDGSEGSSDVEADRPHGRGQEPGREGKGFLLRDVGPRDFRRYVKLAANVVYRTNIDAASNKAQLNGQDRRPIDTAKPELGAQQEVDASEVGGVLLSDLRTCLQWDLQLLQRMLPHVFFHLAGAVQSSHVPIVHLLLTSANPASICQLEVYLRLGMPNHQPQQRLTVLSADESRLQSLVATSAQWDSQEQQWLWRIVCVEARAGKWPGSMYVAALRGAALQQPHGVAQGEPSAAALASGTEVVEVGKEGADGAAADTPAGEGKPEPALVCTVDAASGLMSLLCLNVAPFPELLSILLGLVQLESPVRAKGFVDAILTEWTEEGHVTAMCEAVVDLADAVEEELQQEDDEEEEQEDEWVRDMLQGEQRKGLVLQRLSTLLAHVEEQKSCATKRRLLRGLERLVTALKS